MIVFFARLMVVSFMPLFIATVGAGAGVFGVFTGRALGEFQVELFGDGLGVRSRLDLNNDREVLAFGDRLVGHEFISVHGEGQLGRGRAVAHGDGDGLSCGCDDFAGCVEEADLHFLFRGDAELGIRRDRVDDAATVRGFDFLRRIGEGEVGDDEGDDFSFHLVCCFRRNEVEEPDESGAPSVGSGGFEFDRLRGGFPPESIEDRGGDPES